MYKGKIFSRLIRNKTVPLIVILVILVIATMILSGVILLYAIRISKLSPHRSV